MFLYRHVLATHHVASDLTRYPARMNVEDSVSALDRDWAVWVPAGVPAGMALFLGGLLVRSVPDESTGMVKCYIIIP